MNLPIFTENVNVHQSLPDQPTLTAIELKKKWDEGASKIKAFINETLIPALNEQLPEELEAQRESILNEVNGLLNALKSTYDTKFTTVNNDINTIKNDINTINGKITSINNSITTINNNISSLTTKVNNAGTATTASVTMGTGMNRTYEHTYKVGNVVHSHVEINTGISGNQTITIFTLPSGFRPSSNRKSTTLWSNGDFDGRYETTIYTNGAVQISVGQVPPTRIVADINFAI